ncbi:MAG: hypothetical protein ABWZ76_13175 [Acidimicrobiales bacterium]
MTAFEEVLGRLARPYDAVKVTGALLGVPPRSARQVVGALMATATEVDELLEAMPRILRSMSIATTDRPERCYGELRGPVLWSETMSARSASAGDPGLFVCATTTKAYDTDENRVLKAALDAIRQAGADAEHGGGGHVDDDLVRHARQNGHRAGHLLEHRTLSGVPVTRITGRVLSRTRGGSRRTTYRPAVEVLRRGGEAATGEQLAARADEPTRAQVQLLAEVLAQAAPRLGRTPLRVARGGLVAGPVAYDHPAGVTVGGLLVTDTNEIRSALERAAATMTA